MEANGEPKEAEESGAGILEADITGITFGLASRQEINKASVNECPITHASQLSNPFLGLPLEFGRCESCGTSDLSQCEGHFGYIELPIPIYHPSHISELKKLLSLLCLKCLKMRDSKFPVKAGGLGERLLGACCEDAAQVSIREVKKLDGACMLQLRLTSKSRYHEGFWNFLERYGFRYGVEHRRTLLPCEVLGILKKLPKETKKKLAAKGYSPQDGYILEFLPVPPNCLTVPDVSDGVSVMSSDLSTTMLRKVLKQVEIIRSSRSGDPNFESHEVEVNDLQTSVQQYLEVRGTGKAARDVDARYGIRKESSDSATKAWLEKMRTLFIRKGSGFSSRSVITGDAFKKVNEIGIPYEIAQRITFEEKVSIHNVRYLQELVDKKLCLTYKDGGSTYSLREGSKGHTFLKPGQVVHRRIMDGDMVFINRPPTTHKHSLQALSVYVHEDHTVKINPLICGPLGADFDGDCIHLFYPQSLAAKAEVLELFSVEKQLLSSHSGNLNLQLTTDALLSLKLMFRRYFFNRSYAQQLAMFVSSEFPQPAILKAGRFGPSWSVLQMLQTALPAGFDCPGDKYVIKKGDIVSVSFGRDTVPRMIPSMLPSMLNEIITYIIFLKGPLEVLNFFNSLQPLLMENAFAEGFSVSLEDFYAPKFAIQDIQDKISNNISPLLYKLRSRHNDFVQRQLDRNIRHAKDLLSRFILDYSALGGLIDSKSDSAITKIVQQIGFLGLQLSNKGKFYSESLFEEMAALFESKYPFDMDIEPAGKVGMIRSSFISGLDPYEVMAHSISTREVIVRSTRGLSEPGTLFKNLMAILRDVVICYDGTVRNVCSNSIIQFEYGTAPGSKHETLFPPGEPVGVLAATAMSNPAYKAVLDSSPNSNSSWEQMKEILLCRVNFRNEPIDRRVILHLNGCGCGRNHCRENAAWVVKNHLTKISLKDAAEDLMVEYRDQRTVPEGSGMHTGLVGHIHLKEKILREQNISILDVQQRCHETLQKFRKKKKIGLLFKKIVISVSGGCYFHHSHPVQKSETPCLSFSLMDWNELYLEKTAQILANIVCPVLLETIIKGDPRIASANIIWISPDTNTRARNHNQEENGELALDVTLEKSACRRSGDAWRIVLDCSLPILHLIDTERSIPYTVKQIEELLGISCAFDQAVQRLSTSVAMVAKGILKEHLILLADTMTCCGTLIGFNSGGYKALSHALGVQVPFTEATLFTPRKCFEKASEKSHTDSLSSVVASCSWGKPVAVGTGSKFDILWGSQEVDLKLDQEIDVYSFLHMVRGTKLVDGSGTGCLGTEVDQLNEREDLDRCLSPEHDGGFEKPSFEDSEMVKDGFEDEPINSGWLNAGAEPAKDSSWDKLDSSRKEDNDASGGWGSSASWGKKMETGTTEPETGLSSWGSQKTTEDGGSEQGWNNTPSWAKKTDTNQDFGSQREEGLSWGNVSSDKNESSGGWGNSASWGKKVETGTAELETGPSSWGSEKKTTEDGGSQQGWNNAPSWAKKTDTNKDFGSQREEGLSWGNVSSDKNESSGGWGNSASWGKKVETGTTEPETGPSSWGSEKKTTEDGGSQQGWNNAPSWAKKTDTNKDFGSQREEGLSWGNVSSDKNESSVGWGNSSSWGKKTDIKTSKPETGPPSWGSEKVSSDKSESSGGWGNSSSWGKKTDIKTSKPETAPPSWGSDKKTTEDDGSEQGWKKSDSSRNFGSQRGDQVGSKSWDSSVSPANNQDGKTSEQPSGWSDWKVDKVQTRDSSSMDALGNDWGSNQDRSWGSKKESDGANGQSWGKKSERGSQSSTEWNKKDEGSSWKSDQGNDSGWGKKAEEDDQASRGWGSSKGSEDNKSENQWARKNLDGNRRGPNPEWKIKKNRPPRPADMSQQDPNAPRLFTLTRQRLDMFTSEEQDILSDVEPIMQSIRRIMRLPDYKESDPLPAEDQTYIVDHVLNFHPDKAGKMGSGVDYIMVSKHGNFQETRCFYVVNTDGRKEDFSYRKCLENFVKGKYPNLAEDFLGKYFLKRDRERERERAVSIPPEEMGTPNNN